VSVIDNAYSCWGTASELVSFTAASALSTSSGSPIPMSGVSRPCHLTGVGAPRLLVNQKVSVRSIDVSPHRNSMLNHANDDKRAQPSSDGQVSSASIFKFESRRTPSPRRDAPEVTSIEFFDYLIAIGGL
jgi:hypothetical protein